MNNNNNYCYSEIFKMKYHVQYKFNCNEHKNRYLH